MRRIYFSGFTGFLLLAGCAGHSAAPPLSAPPHAIQRIAMARSAESSRMYVGNGSAIATYTLSGVRIAPTIVWMCDPKWGAVDANGIIYVPNGCDSQSVTSYSGSDGSQQQLAITGLHDPAGVAIAPSGNILVIDKRRGQVLSFTRTGMPAAPTISGLDEPNGLAVDGSGNIYVADTGHNCVRVFDSAGAALRTIDDGIDDPYGVAVNGAGTIFVANRGGDKYHMGTVTSYRNDGSRAALTIAVRSPRNVTAAADGGVYVVGEDPPFSYYAGSYYGAARGHVYKFHADGTQGSFEIKNDGLIHGIVPLSDGSALVFRHDGIFKYDANGKPAGLAIRPPLESETFAVDSVGNIYVVHGSEDGGHHNDNRLEVYNAQGILQERRALGPGYVNDIAFDANDTMYLLYGFDDTAPSDLTGSLSAYTKSGARLWGPVFDSRLVGSGRIAASDKLYIAGFEHGTIFRYEPLTGAADSDFLSFTDSSGFGNWPGWIAVDSSGVLYITFSTDYLSPKGLMESFTTAGGAGPFSLSSTNLQYRDLKFDSSGNLYIATGNSIKKFASRGAPLPFEMQSLIAPGKIVIH